MAKATDYGLMKAPDGFYFCKKTKTGMPSSDSRKITDEEICAMFEDVLRRNKAETGRDVMTIFSKRIPVFMAKLEPDIRETGVLPKPKLTPEQIQALRMRQMQLQQQQMMKKARKSKMPIVGKFGEPQA